MRITSLVAEFVICFASRNTYFIGTMTPMKRLLIGSMIFAFYISLVNHVHLRKTMIENDLDIDLLLFISVNILFLGNAIATFRFIRQLRKIEKIHIKWIAYGSAAISLAFASIRDTLFPNCIAKSKRTCL